MSLIPGIGSPVAIKVASAEKDSGYGGSAASPIAPPVLVAEVVVRGSEGGGTGVSSGRGRSGA